MKVSIQPLQRVVMERGLDFEEADERIAMKPGGCGVITATSDWIKATCGAPRKPAPSRGQN
jgi:hypothetical protein